VPQAVGPGKLPRRPRRAGQPKAFVPDTCTGIPPVVPRIAWNNLGGDIWVEVISRGISELSGGGQVSLVPSAPRRDVQRPGKPWTHGTASERFPWVEGALDHGPSITAQKESRQAQFAPRVACI
jgi:hypothetical protein